MTVDPMIDDAKMFDVDIVIAIVLRTMEQMETKEAQMFFSWKNYADRRLYSLA